MLAARLEALSTRSRSPPSRWRVGTRAPRAPPALAAVVEAVGQAHTAPVLLAPDGQHDLGGTQRPAVRAHIAERAQPALGHRQVEALDDPRDRALGRRPRPVQLARAQELLDGVLVMALAREQLAVRVAQGAHVLVAAPPQAFQEELPK